MFFLLAFLASTSSGRYFSLPLSSLFLLSPSQSLLLALAFPRSFWSAFRFFSSYVVCCFLGFASSKREAVVAYTFVWSRCFCLIKRCVRIMLCLQHSSLIPVSPLFIFSGRFFFLSKTSAIHGFSYLFAESLFLLKEEILFLTSMKAFPLNAKFTTSSVIFLGMFCILLLCLSYSVCFWVISWR